jgi:hypothetical protein
MNFGCGKYVEQYSAPTIISSYPALNGISSISGETIWVKFSKKMDTEGYNLANIQSKFKFAPDMTAVSTTYPELTPEVYWTEDDSKLVVSNFFFLITGDAKVHITASLEAIKTVSGQYINENSDLWLFTVVTAEP